MGWNYYINTHSNEFKTREYFSKARFLLDENVQPIVKEILLKRKFKVVDAHDADLVGHSDEDYFNYAYRKNHTLVTHDEGFFNDSIYPPHRSPTIVIIPPPEKNEDAFIESILFIIKNVGASSKLWSGIKIKYQAEGKLIMRYDDENGRRTTSRFKIDHKTGGCCIWVD